MNYAPFAERYRVGEWRARVFRDLILSDVDRLGKPPVMLDIGCGSGFDGSSEIQAQLAERARSYVGVEPDDQVNVGEHVSQLFRSSLEESDIPECSIDIAFSAMVLEHVAAVERFWAKLDQVLRPGGVFWGFTVDRRHYFCHASSAMARLGIKNWYLDKVKGRRGCERYENYPTRNLANSPGQITHRVKHSFVSTFVNFSKVGQLDFYVPRALRLVAQAIDRIQIAVGLPGSILRIRLGKRA